jgi:hypothetical protein
VLEDGGGRCLWSNCFFSLESSFEAKNESKYAPI